MTSRSFFTRLLPLVILGAAPALAADAPDAPPAAATADTTDVAELRRQLADAQDKLATALRSYVLLEDENTRLKDESASEALRTQVRQLRDEVAQLAAENAQLKTRLALLGPLPGGSAPARPAPTPTAAP